MSVMSLDILQFIHYSDNVYSDNGKQYLMNREYLFTETNAS